MARSTSSRVTSLTLSWLMVIVIFLCTSFPRQFGNACNVCTAMPNFRVKAGQALVKKIFGEYLSPSPRISFGRRANLRLLLTDECVPFDAGDDRHGVLSEAKVEVFLIPEERETPG